MNRFTGAAAAQPAAPTQNERERLLPLNIVAERLGISRRTVNKKIREGKLHAIDISQGKVPRYRVAPSEIERFKTEGARRQFDNER